jgi:hypothetical protein
MRRMGNVNRFLLHRIPQRDAPILCGHRRTNRSEVFGGAQTLRVVCQDEAEWDMTGVLMDVTRSAN